MTPRRLMIRTVLKLRSRRCRFKHRSRRYPAYPKRPSESSARVRLCLTFGFQLELRLPGVVRHPVDDLARLVLGELDALGLSGLLVPVREAVPAEAGKLHEVDILHVAPLAKMGEEPPEGRGLELVACLFIHDETSLA